MKYTFEAHGCTFETNSRDAKKHARNHGCDIEAKDGTGRTVSAAKIWSDGSITNVLFESEAK